MLEKINGRKFTLLPKIPKENEALCPHCSGIGWMIDEGKGCIEKCTKCNNGLIDMCEVCGKPLKYGRCSDFECEGRQYRLKEEQNELNRLNKANHYTFDTTPKESTGMLYSDSYGYNEGYFNEIEELEDYCDSENKPMPTYVWGTKAIPFELFAYDIVQNALEDSFEDAFDGVDADELQKLQNAMDEFVNYHTDALTTYCVDYNVCIEL